MPDDVSEKHFKGGITRVIGEGGRHVQGLGWRICNDMLTHAVMKSYSTGRTIYYGVIDGQDSERLRRAYPKLF